MSQMRSSAYVPVGTKSPTEYLPSTKQAENRESQCCDRPRYTAWLLPLNVNYGKHSSRCLNRYSIPHPWSLYLNNPISLFSTRYKFHVSAKYFCGILEKNLTEFKIPSKSSKEDLAHSLAGQYCSTFNRTTKAGKMRRSVFLRGCGGKHNRIPLFTWLLGQHRQISWT